MTTLNDITGAIRLYGEQRFLEGSAAQQAIDDTAIAELVDQVGALNNELTQVLDEFEQYRKDHPDATTPPTAPSSEEQE